MIGKIKSPLLSQTFKVKKIQCIKFIDFVNHFKSIPLTNSENGYTLAQSQCGKSLDFAKMIENDEIITKSKAFATYLNINMHQSF